MENRLKAQAQALGYKLLADWSLAQTADGWFLGALPAAV